MCPFDQIHIKCRECSVSLGFQIIEIFGCFGELLERTLECLWETVLLNVLLYRGAAAVDKKLLVVPQKERGIVKVQLREGTANQLHGTFNDSLLERHLCGFIVLALLLGILACLLWRLFLSPLQGIWFGYSGRHQYAYSFSLSLQFS